eukprot:TRINITY_DN3564_c0_g1_i1.p2 TRINITY_DN3564_c0_g1~~TRINITY_DN3564_c0_g1_i1.p2  ORF type:complete len:61 (-),score=12.23 TRINITY_DN3564_c0_g1_i1:192-374(-)
MKILSFCTKPILTTQYKSVFQEYLAQLRVSFRHAEAIFTSQFGDATSPSHFVRRICAIMT